jgi:hypothetical protein
MEEKKSVLAVDNIYDTHWADWDPEVETMFVGCNQYGTAGSRDSTAVDETGDLGVWAIGN